MVLHIPDLNNTAISKGHVQKTVRLPVNTHKKKCKNLPSY